VKRLRDYPHTESRILITVLPFSGLIVGSAAAQVSALEDFPAGESWHGTSPRVKLETVSERIFRTQFRRAVKEEPNLAGHYRVATWGCGTMCDQGGLVDLETGRILPLPGGGARKQADEYWNFCSSAFWETRPTVQTRVDSRLLVGRWGDGSSKRNDGAYFTLPISSLKGVSSGGSKRQSESEFSDQSAAFASCDPTICHLLSRLTTTSI
jgi:hypothetical protein